MSSKWVEVRDSLVEALKIEEVGRDLKNSFVTWLESEGAEFAQKFVDKIIEECKADAPQETGWCHIRDAFAVPVALNLAMYILQFVLTKAAAEAKN